MILEFLTLEFGEYQGYALPDVPTEYLEWLSAQLDLDPLTRIYVVVELERRSAEEPD
jgi:uncharacterized protein (DUF3820 family)